MNSTFRNTASIIALVLLLMVSLYTLSDATSHSATFGKYYNWLLFFNAIGLVALLLLIAINVYKLVVQYNHVVVYQQIDKKLAYCCHFQKKTNRDPTTNHLRDVSIDF